MIKIIKHISVDVASENDFQSIIAKQTDKDSRFLKVRLTNEGKQIDIQPTSVVTINALREDNEVKAFAGTVNDDGTVTVPITNWMLELDGQIKCEISVINAEQRKLSSTPFTISVKAAVYDGDDISDDENYDILVDLIAEVKSLQEEIETKLANGEFNGKDGSIGLVPVDELPTDDYVEGVIYLVKSNKPGSENRYLEYAFVNGEPEPIGEVNVGADLTEYVKNTDYATADKGGTVKASASWGIGIQNGRISITKATNTEIDDKTNNYHPIVPSNLDYAVKKALADSKLADTENAWTNEEKTAARNLIGAIGNTDYATSGVAGVVKVFAGSHGLWINSAGILGVSSASNKQIEDRVPVYMPITVSNLDYAIKIGLTTNTETWTDEEKCIFLLLIATLSGR